MKILVRNNSVGCYNFCEPSSRYLRVVIDITDDETKTLEIDGVKCRLEFSDKEAADELDEPIENLADAFRSALRYASRTFGSTDYQAQCLAFAKAYADHYEDISGAWEDAERKRLEDKIKRLQSQLDGLEFPDHKENLAIWIDEQVVKPSSKSVASYENEIKEYVDGSKKKGDAERHMSGHKTIIEKAKSVMLTLEPKYFITR